jgi:hypothetical protein
MILDAAPALALGDIENEQNQLREAAQCEWINLSLTGQPGAKQAHTAHHSCR